VKRLQDDRVVDDDQDPFAVVDDDQDPFAVVDDRRPFAVRVHCRHRVHICSCPAVAVGLQAIGG